MSTPAPPTDNAAASQSAPQTRTAPAAAPQRAPLTACPACGGEVAFYASVPSRYLSEAFYTPELQLVLPSLRYDRCRKCRSVFAADARRDATILNTTYANLPAGYWAALRPDKQLFERVAELLLYWSRGFEVCDVGCGNGALLEALWQRWNVRGVEPGAAAVAHCRDRGFAVYHGGAADAPWRNEFDAVTCLDTLEHLLDPRAELQAIGRLLRPDGVLIAHTGDAAALTARLAGRAWEYLHCVGHVSILSGRALRKLLIETGFEVLDQRRVSHGASGSLWRWLKRATRAWRKRRGRYRVVPYYRDHQLIVARRRSDNETGSSPCASS